MVAALSSSGGKKFSQGTKQMRHKPPRRYRCVWQIPRRCGKWSRAKSNKGKKYMGGTNFKRIFYLHCANFVYLAEICGSMKSMLDGLIKLVVSLFVRSCLYLALLSKLRMHSSQLICVLIPLLHHHVASSNLNSSNFEMCFDRWRTSSSISRASRDTPMMRIIAVAAGRPTYSACRAHYNTFEIWSCALLTKIAVAGGDFARHRALCGHGR
jgi:hypothetical protein